MFLFEDEIMSVGEAKGSSGLQDRIGREHVSGDDGHTLQRWFKTRFPDRLERREFIRQNVQVRCVVIEAIDRIAVVKRLSIWLFAPPWNAG